MTELLAFLATWPRLLESIQKILEAFKKLGADRFHASIDEAYEKTMAAKTDEELNDAAKTWANIIASMRRK